MNEDLDFHNLMERVGRREEGAFQEFYERFGKLIYSVALSRTNIKFDADEVVDDALTKIWLIAPHLDVKNINPAGWITTVVKRLAVDKYRRNQRLSTDELFIMPYHDQEIELILGTDSFEHMIAPLKEKERKIVAMRLINHYTFDEIAEILHIPSSSVSSTYYRALQKIKSRVKKDK